MRSPSPNHGRTLNVFVLLPRNLDVESWSSLYEQGLVPDRTPYGYHHAEAMGCALTWSRPTKARRLGGLLDRAAKKLLGFDLLHAWRNRRAIFDPRVDVIWTHTEIEHLAVQALAAVTFKRAAPMIAQSVWLMDGWGSASAIKRALHRRLLQRSEVLTFLSPLNERLARELGLGRHTEVVPFGISMDSFPLMPPRNRFRSNGPIRVLSLGNDMHRDWKTLAKALGNRDGVVARVGTKSFPDASAYANFEVTAMSMNEIREAYDWADCVVVPLTENLHASGLTVALETVALGLPLVITDAGGYSSYFDRDCVHFVPAGDSTALRDAILHLPQTDHIGMARRAQQRLQSRELTTEGYARRHVELSLSLLDLRAVLRRDPDAALMITEMRVARLVREE